MKLQCCLGTNSKSNEFESLKAQSETSADSSPRTDFSDDDYPSLDTATPVNFSRDLWWQEGDVTCRTISGDLGSDPLVLSGLHSFSMMDSVCTPGSGERTVHFHQSLSGMNEAPQMTWQLRVGDRMAQARYVISEQPDARKVFAELSSRGPEELMKQIKLIIVPRNVPIPLPLRGPASAVSIVDYFGIDAVRVAVAGGRLFVHVNLHAKWIVKQLLNALSIIRNRSVDLFLVTVEPKCVICSVSLTSTDESINMLHG